MQNYLPTKSGLTSYTVQLKETALKSLKKEPSRTPIDFFCFQELRRNDETQLFLILSDPSGFQVFVVTAEPLSKNQSIRVNPLYFTKVAPAPEAQNIPPIAACTFLRSSTAINGCEGPLLAVTPKSGFNANGLDSTCIGIFDLMTQRFIHVLRGFESPVLRMDSSEDFLIVQTEHSIAIRQLPEGISTNVIYEISGPTSCFRERWLAFPSAVRPGSPKVVGEAKSSAAKVAADVATSIFRLVSTDYNQIRSHITRPATYLGSRISGAAVATARDYLAPEANQPVRKTSLGTSDGDVCMVVDVFTQKTIAQFETPFRIGQLVFSDCGTVLLVTEADGQWMHVYQLLDLADGKPSIRHMYRIFRGVTHAVISHVRFSANCKFLIATTARGTLHMYLINRDGGDIGKETHGKNEPSSYYDPMYKEFDRDRVVEIHSSHRIHLTEETQEIGRLQACFFQSQLMIVQTPLSTKVYSFGIKIREDEDIRLDSVLLGSEELLKASCKSYPYVHKTLFPPNIHSYEDPFVHYIGSTYKTDRPTMFNSPQLNFYSYSGINDPFVIPSNLVKLDLKSYSPVRAAISTDEPDLFNLSAALGDTLGGFKSTRKIVSPSNTNSALEPGKSVGILGSFNEDWFSAKWEANDEEEVASKTVHPNLSESTI